MGRVLQEGDLVLIAIGTPDPALMLRAMECLKISSCFLGPDRGKWKNPYLEEVMVFSEQTWNEKLATDTKRDNLGSARSLAIRRWQHRLEP